MYNEKLAILFFLILHVFTAVNLTSINARIDIPIENIDTADDDLVNLMSVLVKLNKLKKMEEERQSLIKYAQSSTTKLNKRSRFITDYTLSEDEKKRIDQAAITAFKKLKKFYVVASRSRFGR